MTTARAFDTKLEQDAWDTLLITLDTELAAAVEQTVGSARALTSYADVDRDALRDTVADNYAATLRGIRTRRRPDERDDREVFADGGEARARQGVAVTDMLTLWRLGLEDLYHLAGEVVPPIPQRGAVLLEFLELTLAWADFAMLAAAEGHRRGELSRARERQHAQTNFVRRVISGVAAPAEIRTSVEPLGLEPGALYHAVRARPEPAVSVEELERYLGADGLVSRGNGLMALIDGDLCGFIRRLPQTAAPAAIGISEPVALASMKPAFHRAGRALQTALALGTKGTFELADLGVQSAVTADADVGDAMVRTYVEGLSMDANGPVVLDTVERYLVNDRSVEITASELGVHANTVRHRLQRFEEATGRSLRDTETLVEVWWAFQRRRLDAGASGGPVQAGQ